MTNQSASLQFKNHWLKAMLIVSVIVAILLSVSARHASAAGPNLAAGKTATGSIAITSPALITNADKNYANYAGQEVGVQWIKIDLGQSYNLNQVNVWHYFGDGRTYHDVIVQVSNDSTFGTKTTVFNNDSNNSANQGTGTDLEYAETSTGKTIMFTTVSARYVRLWINGSSANGYNHYVEVEVYADTGTAPTATATRTNTPVGPTATRTNTPVPSGGNLALNRPATSSSNETTALTPNLAVDGNTTTTRWASAYADPQWIQIDLGATSTIARVVLNWEAAYGKSYQIQTSNDAVNWTNIYTTTTGDGAIDDLNVSGSGRYIRVYGTVRGTVYGYSLWEFEAYGTGGPTPTNTVPGPTATRTNTSVAPTATRTKTPTPTATSASVSHPANELFDDFSYTGPGDTALTSFGWVVRNDTGGPGPANSGYKSSNISFITDPGNSSNKLMRMAAITNGTAGTGTSQAELDWNALKFLEGTYATRFYMSDAPVSGGPDGDEINETFFTITPLNFDLDLAYSENDFEYLANGGWGIANSPTMWNTTWETYQPDPWQKDGVSTSTIGSLAGWHDLLMTVSGGHVKYYIDNVLIADHSGKYYPESLMSINYNIWYIPETLGAAGTGTSRTYIQQADWLYFTPNTVLTQAQVNAFVADFRAQSLVRKNNVP